MNWRNVIETSRSTEVPQTSSGWGNEVAQRLIRHAAHNAPPPLVERLEEEWLADLATRQGEISRLLFGLGCCWATQIIAREHCALNTSAASTATGRTTMAAYAQSNPTFFSRRTTALVAITGIHVAVIYALATGLGSHLIKVIPPSTVIDFIPEVHPRETPPPPPKFDLAQPPKIDIGPLPEVPIDVGSDPTTIQAEAPRTVVDSTPPQQPPPAPVKRVLGGPDKGFPNSEDYYPPAARRLGEQGNTAIQVCVDPSGKLAAEPTVTQSSGSAHIDEGAIKLAKAGSGHYRPTTENGRPVSSCYDLLFKFNFK